MEEIKVVNVKCGGCANTIKKGLESVGTKNVSVDIAGQIVKFEGNREKVVKKLGELGYPPQGTPEADSLLKKAKSFISCSVGKLGQ